MKRVRKSNKRAIITKAVVILSAAAIVSTGFAAWIISGNDTKDVAGNFQVEAAENQVHTISIETGATDNSIVFGKYDTTKEGAATTNSWLKVNSLSIGNEALSFVVGFTVHNVSGDNVAVADLMEDVNISTDLAVTYSTVAADVTARDGRVLADLYANSAYIVQPTFTYAKGTPVAVSEGSSIYNYPMTLTVATNWGTKFGSKNPQTLTDEETTNLDTASTKTLNGGKQAVATALNNLYAVLKGATFTLTIKSK